MSVISLLISDGGVMREEVEEYDISDNEDNAFHHHPQDTNTTSSTSTTSSSHSHSSSSSQQPPQQPPPPPHRYKRNHRSSHQRQDSYHSRKHYRRYQQQQPPTRTQSTSSLPSATATGLMGEGDSAGARSAMMMSTRGSYGDHCGDVLSASTSSVVASVGASGGVSGGGVAPYPVPRLPDRDYPSVQSPPAASGASAGVEGTQHQYQYQQHHRTPPPPYSARHSPTPPSSSSSTSRLSASATSLRTNKHEDVVDEVVFHPSHGAAVDIVRSGGPVQPKQGALGE